MLPKYEAILTDASCFILLDKIGEITLLKQVFGSVTTTEEIVREVGKSLPDWVKIKSLTASRVKELLSMEVDPGEASVLALALEMNNPLLILDDYKARKVAGKLGLNYTGTLGILVKAKELGIIHSVKSILDKIQKTNFRFTEKVLNEIIREAGE